MTCDVTYEELAEFAAGEVHGERSRKISEHLASCEMCRNRLNVLRDVDVILPTIPRIQPGTQAILNTRRLISREIRNADTPEIVTLDEVAAYLRISLDQMGEIIEDLPVFEIAGQIRLRRAKLIEWIEQREQSHMRSNIESNISRSLKGVFRKGVA
jgi:hypothetical protein